MTFDFHFSFLFTVDSYTVASVRGEVVGKKKAPANDREGIALNGHHNDELGERSRGSHPFPAPKGCKESGRLETPRSRHV